MNDWSFNFVGKEIISEIEVLQVDKKNRPMTEARIFNSGELVPKSKVCHFLFLIIFFYLHIFARSLSQLLTFKPSIYEKTEVSV